MEGAQSRIVFVYSSLFLLLVCWAVRPQFLASWGERSELDQCRSLLGMVNLSNLGDDGTSLGNSFEGEEGSGSGSGSALAASQHNNCLRNVTAQRNFGPESDKLGQANASKTSPHSLSNNLGQANATRPVPDPYSNEYLVIFIILLVLTIMVAFFVVYLYLAVWYEWLEDRRIARAGCMPGYNVGFGPR